jgi:hypothetical protein
MRKWMFFLVLMLPMALSACATTQNNDMPPDMPPGAASGQ